MVPGGSLGVPGKSFGVLEASLGVAVAATKRFVMYAKGIIRVFVISPRATNDGGVLLAPNSILRVVEMVRVP